jgi:hypothetical protein
MGKVKRLRHVLREMRSKREKNKQQGTKVKLRLTAHIGFGLLVGPSIDQQPHAVHAPIKSGPNQRRKSALRVRSTAVNTAAMESAGIIISQNSFRMETSKRSNMRYTPNYK